jgi:ATP-dependent helicase HrpA
MAAGTRRLLLLGVPAPIRGVQAGLSNAQRLALAGAPHDGIGAVLADATTAALDALIAEAGGPAWDAEAFKRLRGHVAGRLQAKTAEVVAQMARILDAARDVERRLEGLSAPAFEPARRDVRAQLARLVHPGFATRTGAARLPDVERYLQGAARRLERLPDATAVDRDRMNALRELEQVYQQRLQAWPRGRAVPAGLREVPWMLEELRISQFAQGLGTRGAVSAKRIRRALEEAAA